MASVYWQRGALVFTAHEYFPKLPLDPGPTCLHCFSLEKAASCSQQHVAQRLGSFFYSSRKLVFQVFHEN